MSNIVPEKSNNFAVYINGSLQSGIAEGNFPNIEFMTSEVKGAGLAGVVESPGLGQIQSFTVELTWRTTPKNYTELFMPQSHTLDLYNEDLSFDAGLGVYRSTSVHVFLKAVTKGYDLGKLAVNESKEAKTTHECYYLKMELDGVEVLEIDKYNYIYKVRGVDYLRESREALGMM